MRSYGQYCPIARASELLAERWSIIILRNIVILGCRTFNEIADCAPGIVTGAAVEAAAGAGEGGSDRDPAQARWPRLDLRAHGGWS